MPDDPPDHRTQVRLARLAMRTRFEVLLVGNSADSRDAAHLRAAGEEALDEIERAESLLSAFDERAELRRINTTAAREPVHVSPLMISFLRQCCALSDACDGAFDPAIGALLDCWRIQGNGDDRPEPDAKAIAAALAACDIRQQLTIDAEAGTVRLAHPSTRIDPGAVGKGWALDRSVRRLRDAGAQRVLIHGGTSTASGVGGPWTVAVRHPTDPNTIIATAHLTDSALSVSGQHGRMVSAGGRLVGHILDPRSGHPVEGTLLAAVIHPSATVSDALSTALLVLGADGLDLLTARFADAQLLLVRAVGAEVVIHRQGDGFA